MQTDLCKTIRTFLVDDDIRSTGCRAHDNARELVEKQDALNHLCRFLKQAGENVWDPQLRLNFNEFILFESW